MYIIYDARHFEDYYSGLSRYSFSVLKSLILDNKYSKLEIIFNKNYDYKKNPLFIQIQQLTNNKISFIYLDAPIFSIKQHFTIAKYVNKTHCNIYFYPHFDIPLLIKVKSIFVIHDLFPLILKNYILKYSLLKKLYFKMIIKLNLLKKNTTCISVSKTTKNDIIHYFGKNFTNKIQPIYEDSFSDNTNAKVTIEFNKKIQTPFIFYIGGRREHKNLKQMIDIFNILIEKKLYTGFFIIAGSKKNFSFNVERYVQNNKNIKILGQISDSELSFLYSKMDALFFLSKYEGFGLPIIESAKYNKKIITSNLGACAEILPDSGLEVNIENDNNDISLKISNYLLEKNTIKNQYYLKKFDWLNTVNLIYKKGK
jgi:glycosyltransferase involved in cell wall biosynthesis